MSLELSQNSASSLRLQHDLTQLQSTQGISGVNLLCSKSSTHSDVFSNLKLATVDETPAGINLSRPNVNNSTYNGCVIPSLHESSHFASTGTGMRDSSSVESPLEVDDRSFDAAWLLEWDNIPISTMKGQSWLS